MQKRTDPEGVHTIKELAISGGLVHTERSVFEIAICLLLIHACMRLADKVKCSVKQLVLMTC